MSLVKDKWVALATLVIMLVLILFSSREVNSLLTQQDIPENAITVDASGHWFVYADSGEPYFMAGLGGPEKFLYLNNNRKQEIVDAAIQYSVNAIYIHSIRSHGGDGRSNENPFFVGLAFSK